MQVQALVEGIIERQDRGAGSLAAAWGRQFSDAIVPGAATHASGSPTPLTPANATLHYICITWKLLFAFGPPPQLGGGLPCFFACLVYMAAITYLITNLATMWGCAVGLSNQMTAITVLAVGTSLPDAFGSYQAAVEAADADAAIANITGSNALNVFVGLGVPWVVATIYYGARGEPYAAPAGPLPFSALVYFVRSPFCCVLLRGQPGSAPGSCPLRALTCVTAFAMPPSQCTRQLYGAVCLTTWQQHGRRLCVMQVGSLVFFGFLWFKRVKGGEFGGRGFMRRGISAICFSLWLGYLILSGLQDGGHITWGRS